MREAGVSDLEPAAVQSLSFAPAGGEPALTIAAPGPVLELVPLFLHGWEIMADRGDAAPVVRCEVQGGGFEILAPVLPGGRHRAASAFEAADILASSLAALSIGEAGTILPHAAALASPAGLVLLFADSTGGKSTLAVTLAMDGWRLFGDDRLGLRRDEVGSVGIALGLAAKLRLPLPHSAQGLAAFVGRRLRGSWPTLAYLELQSQEQARAGSQAPVAACLLLERSGGPPLLEPAHSARLVHALAESAAAPWMAPAEVMAAAASHADLPVYRLRYSEAAEAAPLLRARFGHRD